MKAVCSTFFKSFDLLWEFPVGPLLACLLSLNAARKPSSPTVLTCESSSSFLHPKHADQWSIYQWMVPGTAGEEQAGDGPRTLDVRLISPAIDPRYREGTTASCREGDRNTLLEPRRVSL